MCSVYTSDVLAITNWGEKVALQLSSISAVTWFDKVFILYYKAYFAQINLI